ncbi:hypothetical protein [uncultured Erythrobacter sp.]|nr:hypothetical protein [uncultured Erythrobacter sp.]
MQELAKLRLEWESRLRKLSARSRKGQHAEVRRLLRSRHLYPLFAFHALKAKGQLQRASPSSVLGLGNRFDPFNPVRDEPVTLLGHGGVGDTRRTVQDFGLRRRMHQYAVSRILRQLHPLLERQKLFNGGMPMALRAIEDAYSEGAVFACEVDFVGFYGSIQSDGLAEIMRPLPSSVTQHVLWDDELRSAGAFVVPPVSVSPAPTSEAPEGLALGSATSPVVGEVIICHLLKAARLAGVVTYADNLCVYGHSEARVEARLQRLNAALTNSPLPCASGLSVRDGGIRQLVHRERVATFGFEFAKHETIVAPPRIEDEVFPFASPRISGWGPSSAKVREYQIVVAQTATLDDLNRAISKVKNWRRAYPTWRDGDALEAEYLASLKVKRFLLARSRAHRDEAITAITEAFFADDKLRPHTDFFPEYDAELDEAVQRRLGAISKALRRRRAAVEPG